MNTIKNNFRSGAILATSLFLGTSCSQKTANNINDSRVREKILAEERSRVYKALESTDDQASIELIQNYAHNSWTIFKSLEDLKKLYRYKLTDISLFHPEGENPEEEKGEVINEILRSIQILYDECYELLYEQKFGSFKDDEKGLISFYLKNGKFFRESAELKIKEGLFNRESILRHHKEFEKLKRKFFAKIPCFYRSIFRESKISKEEIEVFLAEKGLHEDHKLFKKLILHNKNGTVKLDSFEEIKKALKGLNLIIQEFSVKKIIAENSETTYYLLNKELYDLFKEISKEKNSLKKKL